MWINLIYNAYNALIKRYEGGIRSAEVFFSSPALGSFK